VKIESASPPPRNVGKLLPEYTASHSRTHNVRILFSVGSGFECFTVATFHIYFGALTFVSSSFVAQVPPPPNRHCLTQQYHVQVPNTVVKVAVPGIDQAARISKYAIVALALESTLQWAV